MIRLLLPATPQDRIQRVIQEAQSKPQQQQQQGGQGGHSVTADGTYCRFHITLTCTDADLNFLDEFPSAPNSKANNALTTTNAPRNASTAASFPSIPVFSGFGVHVSTFFIDVL